MVVVGSAEDPGNDGKDTFKVSIARTLHRVRKRQYVKTEVDETYGCLEK